MSDPIDWGNLIELYRECNKPIRKDENRFYEFSSTVYMNFGAIIKERESQAKRIAELEAGRFDSIPDSISILELVERCQAQADSERQAIIAKLEAAQRLRDALIGVIRVADRATDEFDAAREALAAFDKETECL